jgi:ketosteroid isomerase-like protein
MADLPPIVERMRTALDAHDLDAYIGFFREDFVGERPRHPGGEVRGRDEVRESWAEIIGDVPDMQVEVPAAVQDGDTIWSEWRIFGTARSGSLIEIRGVMIFGVREERVAWARTYLEPVEQAGKSLAELIGELPPAGLE